MAKMVKFPLKVVGASTKEGVAGLGGRAILQTNFANLRSRMKDIAQEKAEQAAAAVILVIRQGMEDAGGGRFYEDVHKKGMLFKNHTSGSPGGYPAILSGELVSSLRFQTYKDQDKITTTIYPQGLASSYPLALITGIMAKSHPDAEERDTIHYFPWLSLGYHQSLPLVTQIMTQGWTQALTSARHVVIERRAISDAQSAEFHQARVKAGKKAMVSAQLRAANKKRRR